VASPDYLARHGVPIHPEELSQHLCLSYTLAGAHQRWAFLVDGRREIFPIDSWLDANNGEVLTEAVAQGMGIAMQPDFIVAPFIEQSNDAAAGGHWWL
jgi:DNA-binding transcriptional LysR family regulator